MKLHQNQRIGRGEDTKESGLRIRFRDSDFPNVWRWGMQHREESSSPSIAIDALAQHPTRQGCSDVSSAAQQVYRRLGAVEIFRCFLGEISATSRRKPCLRRTVRK